MNWYDKLACKNRMACVSCRCELSFRESVVKQGLMDDPEFPCPYGITCEAVEKREIKHGPGTVLKSLLSKFGITEQAGCGCGSMMSMMNRRGAEWCRQNVDVIVAWMVKEANQRDWLKLLPFKELTAKLLVVAAIDATKDAGAG